MQGNQQVEKFSKKHRITVGESDKEAIITTGKKLNKTKRGGGVKGVFRTADDSYVNLGKFNGGDY